jgi:hypothetical protein
MAGMRHTAAARPSAPTAIPGAEGEGGPRHGAPHHHHQQQWLQLTRRDDLRSLLSTLPWAAMSRFSSKGQLVRVIVDPFRVPAAAGVAHLLHLGGAQVPLSTVERRKPWFSQQQRVHLFLALESFPPVVLGLSLPCNGGFGRSC